MNQNLITGNKINYTATAVSTTSAEVNSSAVDTAGYDCVTFLVPTSAARIVKLQGGTTSTNATNDFTGCSATTTAAGVAILSVYRPQYRFVRATTVTGVTAVVGDTISILSIARDKPVTNTCAVQISTTTD